MIPKIIHYCWFGGNPKPIDVQNYINQWSVICPDYKIQEWNEANFDINESDYCKEAYEAKQWAFVTDYVRLKALYDVGGFYLDTDVEIVKNLDPLRKFDAFSGYETKNTIPTGTMGAVPGNEWIGMLMHDYDKRHFYKPDGSFDKTTNVKVITSLTKEKYKLHFDGELVHFGDNMVILPFDYLCAKNVDTGEIHQTNNTYTIHHFKGTWLTEEDRFAKQIRGKLVKILSPSWSSHIARYLATIKFRGIIKANKEVLNWLKQEQK